MKGKKKRIIFIVAVFIMVYSGLYLNKIIRYYYYDSLHPFGQKDQYILDQYYLKNQDFPKTEKDLQKFIIENNNLFKGNG